MNKDELAREIAEDFRQVKLFVNMRSEMLYNRVHRKGEQHISFEQETATNGRGCLIIKKERPC